MRNLIAVVTIILTGLPSVLSAVDLKCALGDEVAAGLGKGITLRTCMWEREPGDIIRVGPLELIKNGILILKTQTNNSGQLHGLFTSWDDTGVIIEQGNYIKGQKDGAWLVTNKMGVSETLYYKNGELVKP